MKAISEEQQKQITTTLAIAVAACVLVWVFYQYVLCGLYLDKRDALYKQIDDANKLVQKNKQLVDEAKRDSRVWTTLNIMDSQKEKDAFDKLSAQAWSRLSQLASQAGMVFEDWQDLGVKQSPGRPDFQEVRFVAKTRTTTARVGGFLLALERNAEFPARVDQMKIHSKTPGQDDLEVDLSISALVYSPKATAATRPGAGAQAGMPTSAGTMGAEQGPRTAAPVAASEPVVDPKLEAALIERRKLEEEKAAKAQAELDAFNKLPEDEKLKWLEKRRIEAAAAATQKAAEDAIKQAQMEAEMEKRRQQDIGAATAPGGTR